MYVKVTFLKGANASAWYVRNVPADTKDSDIIEVFGNMFDGPFDEFTIEWVDEHVNPIPTAHSTMNWANLGTSYGELVDYYKGD